MFAAVMIRLMLVLSPAASMLAGIGAAVIVTGIVSHLPRVRSKDKCPPQTSVSLLDE